MLLWIQVLFGLSVLKMFQRFHLNIIAGDLHGKMLPQKITPA